MTPRFRLRILVARRQDSQARLPSPASDAGSRLHRRERHSSPRGRPPRFWAAPPATWPSPTRRAQGIGAEAPGRGVGGARGAQRLGRKPPAPRASLAEDVSAPEGGEGGLGGTGWDALPAQK